jgi:hypothetical protein
MTHFQFVDTSNFWRMNELGPLASSSESLLKLVSLQGTNSSIFPSKVKAAADPQLRRRGMPLFGAFGITFVLKNEEQKSNRAWRYEQ